MNTAQRWASVLLAGAVLAGGHPAWAQAVFGVASVATTVIRTGHTEPVGNLTLWVVAGTSVAGVIEIDLSPAVLTSDTVFISTSGAPATDFSATVDPDAAQVRLQVPAGVGPGALVHLEGLRISVPASGIESLEARITTAENRLPAGSQSVQVVGRARRRHRHRPVNRFGLHLQLGSRTHRPSRPLHVQ